MGHSIGVTGYKTDRTIKALDRMIKVFFLPLGIFTVWDTIYLRLINHSSLLMNNGRKH